MCPNPVVHKFLLVSIPGLMATGCITAALDAASAVGICAPAAPRPPKPEMAQPLTSKMLESWADTVGHQPRGKWGKKWGFSALFQLLMSGLVLWSPVCELGCAPWGWAG